jgi:threonine dehydratase
LVRVTEDELSTAVLRLVELEKSVVEGAAPPIGCLPRPTSSKIGGARRAVALAQHHPTMLSRVIEHGLVADGRQCRFTANISDRPGGLAISRGR